MLSLCRIARHRWCRQGSPDHRVGVVERVDLDAVLAIGAHLHHVAWSEMLPFGKDLSGAGGSEVVEQVVAVPASPPDSDGPARARPVPAAHRSTWPARL